jgi:hypothetical protein
MRKLLSLTTGLAMLFCFSLIGSTTGLTTGSAANPAESAAPAQDGTMPALTAIAGQGMMSAEAYDDLEELSDSSPWPPERTAKMLVEKHNDVMLKSYGSWPFGDLGKPDEKKPAALAQPGGGEN